MALVKSNQIANCCHPNALITLQEYLQDYASPQTITLGEAMIRQELNNIPNPKAQETAKRFLEAIKQGKRDFRF
jgi:2-iminoacetate synthase